MATIRGGQACKRERAANLKSPPKHNSRGNLDMFATLFVLCSRQRPLTQKVDDHATAPHFATYTKSGIPPAHKASPSGHASGRPTGLIEQNKQTTKCRKNPIYGVLLSVEAHDSVNAHLTLNLLL